MQRTPRSSPASGLSSRGTLGLALAGMGVLGFLVFVLPRLAASGSAEARGSGLHAPASEPATPAGELPAPVLLVPAPVLEQAAEGADGAAAPASAALEPAQDVAAMGAAPKIEGPKLQHVRGEGKSEKIAAGSLRAEYRERGKERRARAAEEANALGTTTTESETAKAANPNRSRIEHKGGKGRPGKRKDPPEKPSDG